MIADMIEDNDLLIKDVCAKFPYSVICEISNDKATIHEVLNIGGLYGLLNGTLVVKPYLRPMSSMTEEEYAKARTLGILFARCNKTIVFDGVGRHVSAAEQLEAFDFLNKHHFDYRGLIEKGLAIEALKGMYNLTN